jgi:DNA helicase II / ATP-dependent DNA helicase PcrA
VRDYRINGGELSDEQREVLNETGDLLVVGRPGSGKTSIALLKALRFLDETADELAKVLFLSFSNAAVHRIQAAARVIIPRSAAGRLQVTTFHAFCFGVLHSHARLVGLPRLGVVVLPHEKKIIESEHGGTKDGLAALEKVEGRVSFDRFVPLTLALFNKHPALRAAYAAA